MMFYETKFQLFPHSGWCCSKNQLPFIHHKIGDVCAIDNYKQIVSSFNWHYLSILYCLEKEPIWKLSWVKTWLINEEKSWVWPKSLLCKKDHCFDSSSMYSISTSSEFKCILSWYTFTSHLARFLRTSENGITSYSSLQTKVMMHSVL